MRTVTGEAALIRRAQAGDRQAFEQLLESHYDTLFRFAYHWCRDQSDAEDITQQACIRLARTLGQFRFEAAFTSWLYRLVINCAKDWQRSQQRHNHDELDETCATIEQDGFGDIFASQVMRLLDGFADGIKEAVLLVHAEGLSHAEAAGILGVKESTVSWRIHEARKQLKLLLQQESR
ncbi:MAG: RNA polymerase sigma factor [Gammaproteobacteria bacterium]